MTTSRLSRVPHLSRRRLLTAGGALGAGALITACGGDDSDGSDDSGQSGADGSGAFRFTDDRGESVRLESVPANIVAFIGSAAVLRDHGIDCVGVFGPTTRANGEPDVQAGEVDVNGVTILGQTWGEFNVEDYAQLEPELLISNMFEPSALWYVPEESAEEITGLASSVGIQVAPTPDRPNVTLTTPIERYAELAEALGADMTAAAITDARTRFDAAAESLRQAARDNPGIRVLACSADADLFYASDPESSADLVYFRELGVELITPEQIDEGGYFQSLSWENADTYPADVLLLDNRSVALQPGDLTDKPTWNRMPAVRAGQITPWSSEPRYSYAGCAPLLEELAEAIRNATRLR
jgi:iron-desferrioxamine transport system substrate-binding protein